MIINIDKQDVRCEKCGNPFFNMEKKYSFSKDMYSPGHVIPCNFVTTVLKCSECGEVLDTIYDDVEIVKP